MGLCLAAVLSLIACTSPEPTTPSLEQLIAIVEEPNSTVSTLWFALRELEGMGPEAAPAAPALARALRHPRRDYYGAGWVLIKMGPAAESAVPELVVGLEHSSAGVRRHAAFVLGTIGESARCAVPKIARLLRDPDSGVRTAAAGALELIAGVDLVEKWAELDPSPSNPGPVSADEPVGHISGRARPWWLKEGQFIDWSTGRNLCSPENP
jgi:HEAT repeat protein